MRGYLVTNAFLRGEGFDATKAAFLEAARRMRVRLLPRANAELIHIPDEGCDFALFYDKDLPLAMRLEARMRLFNRSVAIMLCDDKTLAACALGDAPCIPDTIPCPKSYPGVGYGDMSFLRGVGERLGYPLIIKEGNGSFGQQVYLARSPAQARAILLRVNGRPALFQRFIKESAGRDARLFVVGERVIAAIRRENLQGDFRANIANGGVATAYTPTKEEAALALNACARMGVDFAGVDLLFGRRGPLLCEINTNAHFEGLARATGVNPAEHILSHIRRTLRA